MTERTLTTRQAEEEFECIDDDELETYLEIIAPYVGWVVVYFNSLEDIISFNIREAVLRDPFQDERVDVFLSEMQFAGKCRALMNLYGQMIAYGTVKYTQKDLKELENTLLECSKRRNEYAHADWISAMKGNYVRVKSQSKKLGVFHRYKKFEISKMEIDIEFINEARNLLETFNDGIHNQLWGRE